MNKAALVDEVRKLLARGTTKAAAVGATEAVLAAVKRGDKVITGGGILGTVQRVPMVQDKDGKQVASNEIEIEIAPNVRVTVVRDTISAVIRTQAANDSKPG